MLEKKQKNIFTYLKYLLLIIVIVIIFVFRAKVESLLVSAKIRFFYKENNQAITESEREELVNLRIQNKLLQEETTNVRNEFSVGIIDEVRSPVYLLLSQSSLYGDFYVSLPKDKTVYKGMNIFSSGNVVIGEVIDTLPNSLKVERLGQNKSFIGTSMETDEFIELKSLSSGLYVGSISGGSKVSVGDTIVLKGYPKAVVGTVVEITKSDTALSNIYVRTPYNIQSKEIFYVLQ